MGHDDTTRIHARRWRPVTMVTFVLLAVLLTGCSESRSGGLASSREPTGRGAGQIRTYAALGDSYSSAPLVPVTDVANGCFRSSNNYPTLVAEALDAHVADRTCGSATTSDMTRSQHPDVPPQLEAVTKDTDLVTVGIGGNDQAVFSQLVEQCTALHTRDPHGAPCAAYMKRLGKGSDALLADLQKTSRSIATVLTEVHRRAPGALVLAVGYPQLVAADDQCAELPLADGDYAYGEKINRALSDAVRRAAESTGSTYIDVWKASQGHDICSDDPWINGSVSDEKAAARYHPFAVEQQAVAKLVVVAARG